MPVDYHKVSEPSWRFPECRFRYCLSLSPRWIGNKQILNHISTFAMWLSHSWVQSRKHYEHGTLLHLHFYHFLEWKATLRDKSPCLSGFGVVNGIQSLALHTASRPHVNEACHLIPYILLSKQKPLTCDTNHSLSPGKLKIHMNPWTYGK